MAHSAPTAADLRKLNRLHKLAKAHSERELAKLSEIAGSMNRLRGSIEQLRETEAPLAPTSEHTDQGAFQVDPAILSARLAHLSWSETQRTRLNQQLALVTADYLKLRPAAVRAFGRANVLDKLHEDGQADLKRRRMSTDSP